MASPAFAHGSEHHASPATTWTFDPLVILLLAVTGWLYVVGVWRLWRSAGARSGIRTWEAACFAGGWLAIVAALLSPVDAMGEVLFSAHMAQHEILMLVAAPLLVLGRPLIAFVWAFDAGGRRRLASWTRLPAVSRSWEALTGPFTVWLIHFVALWAWHLPSLFQMTLRSDFVHALQHSSFFLSAALFWFAVIHGRYGRLGYGMSVLYVFTTALHSSILGALLTFAPRSLYPAYATTSRAWGLDPLEDQQLAGLIMWVPSGVVFLVVGLALFAAWIGEAERRSTPLAKTVAKGE